MEHDGEIRQLVHNGPEDVKAQLGIGAGLKLISAVGGADGDSQGIAAGAGDELLHLFGTGEAGIVLRDVHVVFYARKSAQLRFHHHAVVVGVLHHPAGDGDIFFKGLGRSIDHNGGIAAIDAEFAHLKAAAVIQVQRHRNVGTFQSGSLGQFYHISVVFQHILGHLQDHGSGFLTAGFTDGLDGLHIVKVERADGIAATVRLLEHLFGSYECHRDLSLSKNNFIA